MPNHVTNKLLIRGPLTRVQALLKQGRVTVHTPEHQFPPGQIRPATSEEHEFSLRGFIPPPDHPDYSSGGCSHAHSSRGLWADPHPNCWYAWNTKHWGTKWDCYEVSIKNDVDTILESLTHLEGEQYGGAAIYFDTAWSPPMPVIKKIVELYPDLDIEFTYMDEDMFGHGGGRQVYRAGKLVEKQEGVNNKKDPLFNQLATDLKCHDLADYA